MTPKAPISHSAADDVGVAHARWWDALRHEDVAVLDILLADNLTFHGPSGGVTTKAKYLEPALGPARPLTLGSSRVSPMGLGPRSVPTSSRPGTLMRTSPSASWKSIGTCLGASGRAISALKAAGQPPAWPPKMAPSASACCGLAR